MEASRKAAQALVLAAGFAALAGGIAGVVVWRDIEAAYLQAYGGGGASRGHTAVIAGLALAVAADGCCLYAASQLRSGRRWPTWLTCGLIIFGLIPAIFGGGTIIAPRIVGVQASAIELGADIAAVTPGWYVPLVTGLSLVALCAAALAAMLAAVPQYDT
ncbi:hypothetical protein ACQP00_11080 [Dactylosporangium sp. CS-047395]|uniref:hypothetical protein n=1 Tax=Dactylosporangium sp. CS-047395 TaxID=3239936 RepID=UPI003D8CD1F3